MPVRMNPAKTTGNWPVIHGIPASRTAIASPLPTTIPRFPAWSERYPARGLPSSAPRPLKRNIMPIQSVVSP